MAAGQLLASGGFGHTVPAPGGVCVSTGLFLGWEILFFCGCRHQPGQLDTVLKVEIQSGNAA